MRNLWNLNTRLHLKKKKKLHVLLSCHCRGPKLANDLPGPRSNWPVMLCFYLISQVGDAPFGETSQNPNQRNRATAPSRDSPTDAPIFAHDSFEETNLRSLCHPGLEFSTPPRSSPQIFDSCVLMRRSAVGGS